MYRTVLLAIIIIASISNCCTSGNDNITFTDAPYTVYVRPGSEAAFNVTLKNAGDGYVDVSVIVRSVPDRISVNGTNKLKLVRTGGSMAYPITIRASRDAQPGTYHFEIADHSRIDKRTWETVGVYVLGEGETIMPRPAGGGIDASCRDALPTATHIEEAEAEVAKRSPGLGHIRVHSDPPAADVHLDNVYQGETGADWFWIYNVTPGNHTIAVEKYGYDYHTETVRVSEGNTTAVSASLSEITVIPMGTAPSGLPKGLMTLIISLLAAVVLFITLTFVTTSGKKKSGGRE